MRPAFLLEDKDLDIPQSVRVQEFNKRFFRERAKAWVTMRAEQIVREARAEGVNVDPMKWLADPNFSIAQVEKGLRESSRLRETVTTSMVYSLANVATTASAATAYQLAKVIYRGLCEVKPSKKSEETYFAAARGDLPVAIGENGQAPESRLGGTLTRIKNYDFARIWNVSRNAEDDDQTGQLAKLGATIGEAMAYAEELYALYVFFYAYQAANVRPGAGAGIAGSGIIPPRCIAGVNPSDGGPTTVAGDITLSNAEVLLQAADYVTDIQGNFIPTDPDAIIVAGSRRINARKIFGSPNNPGGYSTAAASGGQAGIAGVGVLAINPLNGELTIAHSPFVSKVRAGFDGINPPWAIGESGKGWVFQDREPLEVLQEAENAGASFRQRSRATRVWRRFGCGVEYGEAWLAGN